MCRRNLKHTTPRELPQLLGDCIPLASLIETLGVVEQVNYFAPLRPRRGAIQRQRAGDGV